QMSDDGVPSSRPGRGEIRVRVPGGSISVVLAALFLLLVVLAAILADVVSPYGYSEQNLTARMRPPVFAGGGWDYVLGTDTLGRDILTRLLHGIRISLSLALLGTIIGAVFGTLL